MNEINLDNVMCLLKSYFLNVNIGYETEPDGITYILLDGKRCGITMTMLYHLPSRVSVDEFEKIFATSVAESIRKVLDNKPIENPPSAELTYL